MSLFGAGQTAGGLFGPILNYFATVETNGCGILHLHRLVWLRGVSHLATLRSQIQSNVIPSTVALVPGTYYQMLSF